MTMAGGVFGLTLEKMLIDSLGKSLESETDLKQLMCTDTYTPNFDTHNFRDDVTNEVANSGTYASPGGTFTTTEITVASPAATQLKYDGDDLAYTTFTGTARGTVLCVVRGGVSSADEVVVANTFGSDVTATAGTFTVVQPANGLFYIDYA